ncbi:hypothetical protein CORC01_13555 [Colletotrichum orchidophilum]|uniref:C6 zinc finger protein n=1 Tax=Colletotrichum orchidophilum TaxID=1209926 RepID=A0A1G4APQ7_9PEZI|nr:uncharacterized protein CORC01_13555 [Colletotrichum orchidophilum]OHE91144.1 hypothetical protein CORC01_13555 [Colletotrichum orchidophilum]
MVMYEEEVTNFSDDFRDWITHPIYTFSRHLISPLLRMGRLLQHTRQSMSWPDQMKAEAAALEEELLQCYDRDVEANRGPIKDTADVLHVNEAMHAAALIMFYTRIMDMPFTTPLIRRNVDKVQREASFIAPSSLSSRAIIFPLFIAGCEAVDGRVRELIAQRILGSNYCSELEPSKVVSHLSQIWSVRDQSPGLTWLEWSQQGNPLEDYHRSS